MPDESATDVAEHLSRAVRQKNLERVARLLAGLETLLALPSQTKAVEYLEEGGERPEVLGATTADGAFVPFYFTDGDRALDFLREQGRVKEDDEAMLLMGGDPALRIRTCLEGGYGGMVVNPRSPHAAVLDREMVRDLAGMLKGAKPTASEDASSEKAPAATDRAPDTAGPAAPAPEEAPTAPEPSGPSSPTELLLRRVAEAPKLEPVPPPDISAEASRERFGELRQAWSEERIPTWELLDGLGFEVGLHVPVRPEPVYGLRWPLVSPHPGDPERPSVRVFTHPDAAEAALADLPDVETVHLSGIEALRWIWAAPARVDGVVFDLYPEGPEHLVIPDSWGLAILYPHFLDYGDLEEVRRVPLGRLGSLPGARGLKAEVVRALVEGWSELVALEPGDDGTPGLVAHEGGRYLPAFSSPDRYFDFDTAHPDRSAAPRPVGDDTAPFRDWLLASADADGVLLDAASEHPLALDHTDLTVLALWCGTGGRPDGTDVAVGIESAREELGERIAGRVVADWPRYYWAQQPAEDDGPAQALTLPDRDACPVFTSEEKVTRFLGRVQDWELVGEGMKPAMYLTGWAFNVFREMTNGYEEGGWINPRAMKILESLSGAEETLGGAFDAIDPDATDGDGLEVSPAMARAALQRIDERLTPRVPGFVA